MFVTAKKYKELEAKLVQQERLFELERTNLKNEIEDLNHTLKFAQANEESLNKMTGSLSKKLISYDAFPSKSFNIEKAINVIVGLSDKALGKFLYDLPKKLNEVRPSHLDSLIKYSLNTKENVNN